MSTIKDEILANYTYQAEVSKENYTKELNNLKDKLRDIISYVLKESSIKESYTIKKLFTTKKVYRRYIKTDLMCSFYMHKKYTKSNVYQGWKSDLDGHEYYSFEVDKDAYMDLIEYIVQVFMDNGIRVREKKMEDYYQHNYRKIVCAQRRDLLYIDGYINPNKYTIARQTGNEVWTMNISLLMFLE